MKTSCIAQPFGQVRAGDWLKNNLLNLQWTEFRGAVAFAKISGVSHVSQPLQQFCGRAKAILSVGVDHRGTSKEALSELLEAMPEQAPHIVHHTGSVTFHPKVFLFSNGKVASALVGSTNLTGGGLYTNYETSLAVDLTLSDDGDRNIFADLRKLLISWADPSAVTVKRLDPALLDQLVATGLVPTEAQIALEQEKVQVGKTKSGGASKNAAALFGSPPIPPAPKIVSKSVSGPAKPGQLQAKKIASGVTSASTGQVRWIKKNIQKSDAALPSLGSAPTANLRLSQARFIGPDGQLIDWKKYFRHEVFGHLEWAPGNNKNLETHANFRIIADNKPLGTFLLRISHNPKRIAGQSNVTTVLHWGNAGSQVKAANVIGKTLTLSGPDSEGVFTIRFN